MILDFVRARGQIVDAALAGVLIGISEFDARWRVDGKMAASRHPGRCRSDLGRNEVDFDDACASSSADCGCSGLRLWFYGVGIVGHQSYPCGANLSGNAGDRVENRLRCNPRWRPDWRKAGSSAALT